MAGFQSTFRCKMVMIWLLVVSLNVQTIRITCHSAGVISNPFVILLPLSVTITVVILTLFCILAKPQAELTSLPNLVN